MGWLTYPNSFEAIKRLKALDPENEEQEPLDVALATLNTVTEGLKQRG